MPDRAVSGTAAWDAPITDTVGRDDVPREVASGAISTSSPFRLVGGSPSARRLRCTRLPGPSVRTPGAEGPYGRSGRLLRVAGSGRCSVVVPAVLRRIAAQRFRCFRRPGSSGSP
ncbi:hypothetical protein GCM10009675_38080 [Prauserella alba]|uniref:Uncharacterized protein n=1 Tax=Prauserella alba TaxID=176898 RepID=A0ABN1VIZ2_9PSEU